MQLTGISKDVLLIVIGGLTAAIINMFRLPLFFEAEFVFGPALVLLIAIFRGPIVGLLTSMIASSTLVWAWGSYWATLTFGMEALFVGLICYYRRWNVILVVMAYWLFIGMPVSWYSIAQYELFLDTHRTAILIKQLTNAIVYAHITALLIYVPLLKKFLSRSGQFKTLSIKDQSSHIIASLLITVGILFFFFNLNQNIKNNGEKFSQSHDQKHEKLVSQLQLIFEQKLTAMTELRSTLSYVWDDPSMRQDALSTFNERYPEFMTMVIADQTGNLLHSSPPELVRNVLLQNEQIYVGDRAYFIAAMEQDAVYVSPGFIGRGFGSDIITAVSIGVPDTDPDQPRLGVVEGSFILYSLKSVQRFLDNIDASVEATLLDQTGQVLMASSSMNLEPLESLTFSKGVDRFYDHELVHVFRGNGHQMPSVYSKNEHQLPWGWRLITIQDEAKFAGVIEQILIIFAFTIVLVVLVSKLLAWSIAHSWSYYMQRLNDMIEQGADFSADMTEFEQNEYLPEEISNLYQEIKLSRQKILRMNQELQNTIAERTEKLQVANAKLNVMAQEDELTQLNNRRVFNTVLTELYAECQKALLPMSMLIIDIDHFKKVNDTYGHPAGDAVLHQLAEVLTQFDHGAVQCLARIGGEEFCFLLKGTLPEQAKNLAERIRQQVGATEFKAGADKSIEITVSVGLATINPTKFTSAKLYQLADTALYEAKNSGRNQVKEVDYLTDPSLR
ncbi:diguanylate cyclase [Marinicella meishanensis]|uniref:diguanylate cyclase n=1 Tax=Marinicella meishanensis TaxID=2873263 RepID=UPI001CC090F0|nr:diguanylate cyclase [Marinicella sp. NBU2979]